MSETVTQNSVDTSPLKVWGTGLYANRLDFGRSEYVKVRTTARCWLYWLFWFACNPLLFFYLFEVRGQERHPGTLTVVFFCFLGVFCALLVFLMAASYLWGHRGTFNLLNGEFIKGKRRVPFASIAALQVIEKTLSLPAHGRSARSRGSYVCYELNLVLGDGSRICILNHGSKQPFERDAQQLAAAINRPIWKSAADVRDTLPERLHGQK